MSRMGITSALIAFLEALGGDRSGPGHPPVAPVPSPVESPPPLAKSIEALGVRMADTEAQLKTIKPYVDEEVDRARRHVEGLRTTVRRLKEFVEGSGEEPDASGDISGGDASAGGGPHLHPVHGRVESPVPDGEAIRAAARRALA